VVNLDAIGSGTGLWRAQVVTGQQHQWLVNTGTGMRLHMERGPFQAGEINEQWWSAMWTVSAGALFPVTPPPTSAPASAPKPAYINRSKADVVFEYEPIPNVAGRVRLRTTAGWLSVGDGRVGITAGVLPNSGTASSEWAV